MHLEKKAHLLLQKQFDIIVVQECECPEKLIFKPMYQEATDTLWFGDNLHKGLGIFSYSHYKFQVSDAYNPDIKFVVPIFVTGGKFDFILFAIWTNHPKDNDGQHIEQVWKAIHYYDFLLEDHAAVLMGDCIAIKITH